MAENININTYIPGATAPDFLHIPTNLKHVFNDYTGFPQDNIVYTGSGLPGGLSDPEFEGSDSPFSPEEFNCRGVKGVFGCGTNVVSFKPTIFS